MGKFGDVSEADREQFFKGLARRNSDKLGTACETDNSKILNELPELPKPHATEKEQASLEKNPDCCENRYNPLFGQDFKNQLVRALSKEGEMFPERVYEEIEHGIVIHISNIIKDLGTKLFRAIKTRV